MKGKFGFLPVLHQPVEPGRDPALQEPSIIAAKLAPIVFDRPAG